MSDTPIVPLARLRPLAVLALFCLVAVATRFQQIGNPIIHLDEEFYLLVGDRMWSHGAIPYVDIWDRKPIGLFLLYAGMRALGGAGIVQYQLIATGFAIATAWVVTRIGARLARPTGAMLAGVLYLLWIPLLTGQGGQSPVFYNLFVALAALMVIRARERERALTDGLAAMLLVGIAMQIKYSALFESAFFGLVLIVLAWRERMRWPLLALAVPAWIVAALLPTLLAGAGYWWIGHLDAWWFSNFQSILKRGALDAGDSVKNAWTLSLYLAPLLITAARGAEVRWRGGTHDFSGILVSIWLIVATLSVVLFGYYFDHYGLPLVVPAAACAAPLLGDRRYRAWTVTLLVGAALACAILPHYNQKRRGTPAQYATLVRAIQPLTAGGLLVWDNLPALYTSTQAPLPGRYPFPTHLRDRNEWGAVGVDQRAELIRILRSRPAVVVVERHKPTSVPSANTRFLMGWLARAYHPIAEIPVGRRAQIVYVPD